MLLDAHTNRKHLRLAKNRRNAIVDAQLDRLVPRSHRFSFFRIGEDVCWRCGKTRKEHE